MADIKEITKTKTLDEILEESDILSSNGEYSKKLILWNDDINSFEFVAFCLIVYVGFNPIKAEKTTIKVDKEGKDIIKTGTLEELEPIKKNLEERGLSLTIE